MKREVSNIFNRRRCELGQALLEVVWMSWKFRGIKERIETSEWAKTSGHDYNECASQGKWKVR